METLLPICIILLVIAAAFVFGLRSLNSKSDALHLDRPEIPDSAEQEPEQKNLRSQLHEKGLGEAIRGPHMMRETAQDQEPTQRFASARQRQLSELLPPQFVVVDLETTGLSPVVNEIIEIGALKITLGTDEHAAFQRLVKPMNPVPSHITRMTGITQMLLAEQGIELQCALQQLITFIEDLPLITYNARFDMGFLWASAKRCNAIIPNRYSCALTRARRAFPDFPSHKLSYMAERFSLSNGNEHRAVGDCERAAHVFLLSTMTLNQKVRWNAPPTFS
ncbi:MAG: PolC-type DNA polymerase III [Acidobacteriota bacterium]